MCVQRSQVLEAELGRDGSLPRAADRSLKITEGYVYSPNAFSDGKKVSVQHRREAESMRTARVQRRQVHVTQPRDQ